MSITEHTVDVQPLLTAIRQLDTLSNQAPSDALWLKQAGEILSQLISTDTWLPPSHAQHHPVYYQQHALYIDPLERFSVSSFVWAPGQGTPIHDHTISGLVGVLRGAEVCQRYSPCGTQTLGIEHTLQAGQVDAVSPHQLSIGDVHTVRNACFDQNSISIHIYRGDIAKTPRHVFKNGEVIAFQSNYSQVPVLITQLPKLN